MINILCCSSNDFCQHCAVMLASLFSTNESEQLCVYLLTTGLNEQNTINIQKLADDFKQSVEIITITDETLYTLPVVNKKAHSIACYLRLFCQEVLPVEVDKVLYFDSDVIIRSSIQELWNTDINDYALAAVANIPSPYKMVAKRLGYPSQYKYFNSGVMLINLKYWRENNVLKQILDYISKYSERVKLCDQDAINAVLYSSIKQLSIKWNMYPDCFMYTKDLLPEYLEELPLYQYNPPTIHYVNPIKPWHIECTHPLRNEYFMYLNITSYKGAVCSSFYPKGYILLLKQCVKQIFVFLHLRKKDTQVRYKEIELQP